MIERKLKNHLWQFDPETKELIIWAEDEDIYKSLTLDKIRMFSLFRFMIRISQKMSVKPRKKKNEQK